MSIFSIAIILMGKRELVALLDLSSWCFVMGEQLFFAVPRGCLRFVIVVFSDHTHVLFFILNVSIYMGNSIRMKSELYIGLKALLQRSISEPLFYGDLVYKFKSNCWKILILVINSKRL